MDLKRYNIAHLARIYLADQCVQISALGVRIKSCRRKAKAVTPPLAARS